MLAGCFVVLTHYLIIGLCILRLSNRPKKSFTKNDYYHNPLSKNVHMPQLGPHKGDLVITANSRKSRIESITSKRILEPGRIGLVIKGRRTEIINLFPGIDSQVTIEVIDILIGNRVTTEPTFYFKDITG